MKSKLMKTEMMETKNIKKNKNKIKTKLNHYIDEDGRHK